MIFPVMVMSSKAVQLGKTTTYYMPGGYTTMIFLTILVLMIDYEETFFRVIVLNYRANDKKAQSEI